MTIEDKIRDEKPQYDINIEAEKISALSLDKINKYEHLTGQEKLPPGQKRVIEQAKSTYYPLSKAFEKQIKTIEDQGGKKIKALEEHGKQRVKSSSEKESLTLLKQKDIFEELANERTGKIPNLSKQIYFNNLLYYFKGESDPKNLSVYKNLSLIKV